MNYEFNKHLNYVVSAAQTMKLNGYFLAPSYHVQISDNIKNLAKPNLIVLQYMRQSRRQVNSDWESAADDVFWLPTAWLFLINEDRRYQGLHIVQDDYNIRARIRSWAWAWAWAWAYSRTSIVENLIWFRKLQYSVLVVSHRDPFYHDVVMLLWDCFCKGKKLLSWNHLVQRNLFRKSKYCHVSFDEKKT